MLLMIQTLMLGNLSQGKKPLVPIPLTLTSPMSNQTKSKPFFSACHFLENGTSSVTTLPRFYSCFEPLLGTQADPGRASQAVFSPEFCSQVWEQDGPPASFHPLILWHGLRASAKKRWACGGPDLSAGPWRLGGGQGGASTGRGRPPALSLDPAAWPDRRLPPSLSAQAL